MEIKAEVTRGIVDAAIQGGDMLELSKLVVALIEQRKRQVAKLMNAEVDQIDHHSSLVATTVSLLARIEDELSSFGAQI